MRRAVIKEFERLGEVLSNYNAVFAFRLKNLCVKAEEVSLLPVEVLVEGELQKLENCTTISKKDEYSFMIFPIYDEDMPSLAQGLMRVHPEFKQKIESMTVEGVDINGHLEDTEVRYLLVTMPDGKIYIYVIESTEILESDEDLRIPTMSGKHLMLTTCYPFYYTGHAPKKYVVIATLNNG